MSYNDLRKGRFSEENRIYFVTTVTYNRKPLFRDLKTARIVIQTMKTMDQLKHVSSLSWVLMPDHLHWLFQLENKMGLSSVIKSMKAGSARSINQHFNREGQVWQKSFYDRGIRSEEDLKQISRYIVANPLRTGLVENIGDYPHWDSAWL